MTAPSFPSGLLNGHRYGVCGLGHNGMAVVQTLLHLGASVQAWDDHTNSLPETLRHHPYLNHAPLTDLRGFEALILSPGIPHHLPTPHPAALLAQELHTPVLSDAEILWQVVRQSGSKARFISITGTNGKSTTTTLLAHILKEGGVPVAAGGNLGTAALALPLLGDEGVYIIEMSSYMLERLQHYHADVAVLLNLTPDHLERHGNMAGYEKAKAHVFDNMGPDDLAVLGEKSAWAGRLEKRLKERHVPVLTLDVQHAVPHALAPALPGRHNAQNIVSCRIISQHLGIDDITIERAIKSFNGLEHRLQTVAHFGKIRFVNDSKATNAEATAQALAAYDHILWIAGGIAKADGIASLAPLFQNVTHSFLIGRDAPLLAQTLQEHHHPFTLCETLENAVSSAVIMAQKHNLSTILLSPACASLDQFKNFEERGTCFTLQAQSYSRLPLSQRSH